MKRPEIIEKFQVKIRFQVICKAYVPALRVIFFKNRQICLLKRKIFPNLKKPTTNSDFSSSN